MECHESSHQGKNEDALHRIQINNSTYIYQQHWQVELSGFDGYGGPCYIGTGRFQRREAIRGGKKPQITLG